MQKVRHPFVVEFIDSMTSHRSVFLITELVRGGDLYDFITEAEDYCSKQVSFTLIEKWLTLGFRPVNLPITWRLRYTIYTPFELSIVILNLKTYSSTHIPIQLKAC